jgi:hypothetical protein
LDLPLPTVGMLFTSLWSYKDAVHWNSILIESWQSICPSVGRSAPNRTHKHTKNRFTNEKVNLLR